MHFYVGTIFHVYLKNYIFAAEKSDCKFCRICKLTFLRWISSHSCLCRNYLQCSFEKWIFIAGKSVCKFCRICKLTFLLKISQHSLWCWNHPRCLFKKIIFSKKTQFANSAEFVNCASCWEYYSIHVPVVSTLTVNQVFCQYGHYFQFYIETSFNVHSEKYIFAGFWRILSLPLCRICRLGIYANGISRNLFEIVMEELFFNITLTFSHSTSWPNWT